MLLNFRPARRLLTSYAMRHKYPTRAIVIGRTPLGEASALVTLLTREVGLVRARAQGLRRPGAKLSSSLVTLSESEVSLVRGTEGWRITGAALVKNWYRALPSPLHARAGRVAGLVLRFAPPEGVDPRLFDILQETLTAFTEEQESLHDAIECQAVLRLLSTLGLDGGGVPELQDIARERSVFVARINRGIEHSGL